MSNITKGVTKSSVKNKDKMEGPNVKQISATKTLTAEGALNKQPKTRQVNANLTPHSTFTNSRSVHYHAKILGGRQSAARITDQLNPDESVSENARNTGRRFPGLAN